MSTRYELYTAALKWHERGYNVVPQNRDGKKYPAVTWKHWQDNRLTRGHLWSWLPMYTAGIGVITGAISDVVVIETDGFAGLTALDMFEARYGTFPETLTVRSGSRRGFHHHFRHPGYRVKTTANPVLKIDVRGDGGFCVLPPSKHKSGGTYDIVRDAPVAPLPRGLLEFIEEEAGRFRKLSRR